VLGTVTPTSQDARHDATPSFSLEGDAHGLRLAGTFHMEQGGVFWNALREHAARAEKGPFAVDLEGVEAIDGGAMALLVQVRAELLARGVQAELINGSEHVQELVHLYRGDEKPARRKKRKPEGTIAHLGRAAAEVLVELKLIVTFLGFMVWAFFGLVRNPKSGNWKDVTPLMEKAGADAVPIVVLINFLLGFVMAFQGARQLKMFGANIFVADLVGIAVTRELAPLMTAIIVCGRSGAAFAAELGSMKVSEEIDALRTMGFGPVRHLVLPRTLALVAVVPLLTLMADFVGVLGGLLVGLINLDLTVAGYISETRKALTLWDVASGLIKSEAFAVAIALIACQQGFATSGGAEGVGRRTTATVVSALFAIVLIDALYTVVLRVFDL
jgi:phospholipid/cholesterol/gamma-HCH transport system permease protein